MKAIYCIIEGFGGTSYDVVYASTNELAATGEWDKRRIDILNENRMDYEEIDASLSLEEQWDTYMENTDTTELYMSVIEELQDEDEEDGDE
jgi:hypothetical protein